MDFFGDIQITFFPMMAPTNPTKLVGGRANRTSKFNRSQLIGGI
jgi:hypothetical protein